MLRKKKEPKRKSIALSKGRRRRSSRYSRRCALPEDSPRTIRPVAEAEKMIREFAAMEKR